MSTYHTIGKVKFTLEPGTKVQRGEQRHSYILSLTSALDGVGGRHAPAALPLGKDPVPIVIGGWVGPRAGLDICGKSRPPPGFDPRTVQPVVSRYTDCAISALTYHTTQRQTPGDLNLFLQGP
jgi:hypothetical protein